MQSIAPPLEQFVRECQWFAGQSSLVVRRDQQLQLVRHFLARLPDAADRAEAMTFRGILLDVAFKWLRHIRVRFPELHSGEASVLPLVEALTSSNGDVIASYRRIFERWVTALLEDVEPARLVSPASRAKEIIDGRVAESLRLSDLARMTGCTSVRLRTLFKQEFGVSLREYRTRARVLNAAKVLAGSHAKIEAIAPSAGFRSKRNFYKAFRRVVGCTPSEIRGCMVLKSAQNPTEEGAFSPIGY